MASAITRWSTNDARHHVVRWCRFETGVHCRLVNTDEAVDKNAHILPKSLAHSRTLPYFLPLGPLVNFNVDEAHEQRCTVTIEDN